MRDAFNLSPVSVLNLNCVHACKYKKAFKTRNIEWICYIVATVRVSKNALKPFTAAGKDQSDRFVFIDTARQLLYVCIKENDNLEIGDKKRSLDIRGQY